MNHRSINLTSDLLLSSKSSFTIFQVVFYRNKVMNYLVNNLLIEPNSTELLSCWLAECQLLTSLDYLLATSGDLPSSSSSSFRLSSITSQVLSYQHTIWTKLLLTTMFFCILNILVSVLGTRICSFLWQVKRERVKVDVCQPVLGAKFMYATSNPQISTTPPPPSIGPL